MASISILDLCSYETNPRSLGTKRRISWLAHLGSCVLGYYWFGWWGILLCVLSSMTSSLVVLYELREILWSERDRIRPAE